MYGQPQVLCQRDTLTSHSWFGTARDIFDIYKIDDKGRLTRSERTIRLCRDSSMRRGGDDEYKVPFYASGTILSFLGYHRKRILGFQQKGYTCYKQLFGSSKFYQFGIQCEKEQKRNVLHLKGITNSARRYNELQERLSCLYPRRIHERIHESRWDFLRGMMLSKRIVQRHDAHILSSQQTTLSRLAQMARSLGAFDLVNEITDDPDKIGYL